MKLIIIGAGGDGKVIADIAEKKGYKEIAFLDDNQEIKTCLNYPVLGKIENIIKYYNADFVVAIGNPKIREKIQKKILKEGLNITTLIHPNAVIGRNVSIGKGTVVMAGAVINPDTVIGEGCIINTGSTIGHDNNLSDYVHASSGSHLAGTVSVGKYTWIGVGACVKNNISICDSCMIGAGAVVVKDIMVSGTYIGVPAKIMSH